MKRTDFHNLVLVSEDDLRNSEGYRVQSLKERVYSAMVGCDTSGFNAVTYFGIVKEPSDLRFVGSSPVTNTQFTIGSGVAYTRFDPTSTSNPQYIGGERIGIDSSLPVTISNTTPAKYYIYLVYVELQRNKKFDEGGSNAYFVDRIDGFLVVQMTQAQATTLGSFLGNPNGSVTVSSITAPYLESKFNNDAEITATFGSFTRPAGVLTIGSYTVTHYNSVFLGEIEVTNSVGPVYNIYHTLPGGDPLLNTMFRSGFSMVDQYHRTEIGRGTISTTNPHAMAIQDLSNWDDVRELTSSGIVPKFTTSLEGTINDSLGRVAVASIAGGEYLFMNGKRVKSLTKSYIAYGSLTNSQVNYIYVSIDPSPSIGGPFTQNSAPWNYYVGTLQVGTSIPGSNAFVLCSVYYDGTHAYAYNGDPRATIGGTLNPVTDLRIFGTDGYDYIHNTIFEAYGKENLVPNGNMQIAESGKIKGWETGTQAVLTAYNPSSGSTALEIAVGPATYDTSLLFPFDSTSDYSVRARLNTQSNSEAYTIQLILFRGKDKVLDQVGTVTVASGTAPSSNLWTLVECEFLANTTITWSPGLGNSDRPNVGWAAIRINNGSAHKMYVDDVVVRPKIRTIDLTDQQITTAKIADSGVTNAKMANNAVTQSKIQTGVFSVVKGHLDGTASTTHIDALVDGGNADSLHSHSLAATNVVFAQAATNIVTFSLSAGTYSISAWARFWDTIDDAATLFINGVSVDSVPSEGDTDGVDYTPLFGSRTVVWGGGNITCNFTVAVTGGVASYRIMVQAFKVA